jgi:hypothetical protein
MLMRYRFARGAGYSILRSLAFSLFYLKPPDIQKQLDESTSRFMEFQKERRQRPKPGMLAGADQ